MVFVLALAIDKFSYVQISEFQCSTLKERKNSIHHEMIDKIIEELKVNDTCAR